MITLMNKMMDAMVGSMKPDQKQNTMLQMMPQMMKAIKGSDIMELFSSKISRMMFVTQNSKFDFEETITKVKDIAKDAGWYNPAYRNHYEIEKSFELDNPNKVATISMCIPRAAHNILKVNKRLAGMMPLQITIFEDEGKVYVSWMDITLMGKMFGQAVADIMATAEKNMREALKSIIKK